MKENKAKEKRTKTNKGITLIALVITIIVLLILASVSISMLTGDNGILTQAQRAKNETENAARKEEQDLAELEAAVTGKDVIITPVHDNNPGALEQEGSDTFVINSIEDLVFFAYDVTNGNKYSGKTVKLGTNLDFSSDKSYVNPNRTDFDKYGYNGQLKESLTSETGFSTIGSQDRINSFYGTFDGDGKAICSLYINMNSNENAVVGFFTTSYGEIKNIGLVNTSITVQGSSDAIVGGLVGVNYKNIYNSYVTGSIKVTGNGYLPIGGLCGATKGSSNIENCYNLASIEGKNIKGAQINANIVCGGIIGQASVNNAEDNEVVNIQKCFNRGNINADGGNNQVVVGGIIGSKVQNSNSLNIKDCYNNAKLQASTSGITNDGIGGIVGILDSASISNCYNLGDIIGIKNGNKTSDYLFGIGGIIGYQGGNVTTINNVFNVGKVISTNSSTDLRIGGILGVVNSETANATINNAYNTGSIEADGFNSSQVGSIAGSNLATFSNCYYLKGTYDVGIGGNETITGVTELDSIDKFPSVLEIMNKGEDKAFKEDTNNINNGYPILEWQ